MKEKLGLPRTPRSYVLSPIFCASVTFSSAWDPSAPLHLCQGPPHSFSSGLFQKCKTGQVAMSEHQRCLTVYRHPTAPPLWFKEPASVPFVLSENSLHSRLSFLSELRGPSGAFTPKCDQYVAPMRFAPLPYQPLSPP